MSKVISVEAGLETCRITATLMPALAPIICDPNASEEQLNQAMDRLVNCYWVMTGKVKDNFDFEPPKKED